MSREGWRNPISLKDVQEQLLVLADWLDTNGYVFESTQIRAIANLAITPAADLTMARNIAEDHMHGDLGNFYHQLYEESKHGK